MFLFLIFLFSCHLNSSSCDQINQHHDYKSEKSWLFSVFAQFFCKLALRKLLHFSMWQIKLLNLQLAFAAFHHEEETVAPGGLVKPLLQHTYKLASVKDAKPTRPTVSNPDGILSSHFVKRRQTLALPPRRATLVSFALHCLSFWNQLYNAAQTLPLRNETEIMFRKTPVRIWIERREKEVWW